MNFSEAKELFRQLTKEYFGNNHSVIFANQGRTPKPQQPLVLLNPGKTKRPNYAPVSFNNDEFTHFYLTSCEVSVDLFSHGKDVYLDGLHVGTEDNTVEELYSFKDFLESDYTIEWCSKNDMAIEFHDDVIPLSNVVNDTTYEFRSRLNVTIYFTHLAVGHRLKASD